MKHKIPEVMTEEWARTIPMATRVRWRAKGINVPILSRPSPKGYGRKNLTCSGCGIQFRGLQRPGQVEVYHSQECYLSNIGGDRNPKWRGGPVRMPCVICGVEFEQDRNGSDPKKNIRKTCSESCHKELELSHRIIPKEQEKLNRRVFSVVRRFLKRGCSRNGKWVKILGFTAAELQSHFDRLFQAGMTWENHGNRGWEIDHKVPLVSFRYESVNDEQFKRAWSISNLRPLWAYQNRAKRKEDLCLCS